MRSDRRVIVLGVDGFDLALLRTLQCDLPNLRSLRCLPYNPVFPPDSIPAWMSLQTGLTVEQHGIITSKDYLRAQRASGELRAPQRDNTFFDAVASAGGSVVVINPFMGYPAWPVSGIMASGPVFDRQGVGISTWPPDQRARWSRLPIGGLVAEPKRSNRQEFLRDALNELTVLATSFAQELSSRNWDCAFLTLLSLDRVEHFFWRFCDQGDPDYPGPTRFRPAIAQAYQEIDRIVGNLSVRFPDAALLVVSDHGHSRRPKRLFEMAEWLRRSGYLRAAPARSATATLERSKRRVVRGLSSLRLEGVTRFIARGIPHSQALKTSTFALSKDPSRVTVCPFGRNTFGGLYINEDEPDKRGVLARRLIAELAGIRTPTGELLFTALREAVRENEIRTPHLADLELELHPDYGIGTELYGPLFSTSPYRRDISGGHGLSPVFLTHGPVCALDQDRHVKAVDLAPTVLSLLGMTPPPPMSGQPVIDWT